MGIFDKKTKKDSFDSPVETIDLGAADAKAATPTEAKGNAGEKIEKAKAPEPKASYGIEEAIALMRTLPSESVELVVRVVKQTLESTQIDIAAIIKDANRKQKDIDGRVVNLKEEIANLEKEINSRTKEIETLEADLKETLMVRERLELAQKLAPGKGKK